MLFPLLKKYIKLDEKIILACSCGPDSIFLLHKILETDFKNNLIVCYFNHKLRIQADEEEKYIKDLGKKLGFKVEIGISEIKKLQKSGKSASLEELARIKRYEFLREIKQKHGAKYILTAHHLDDKIETFFFNLARGTKISGLINMTEKNGDILRPLISITKSEITDYLDKNNIKYFFDETNADTEITRNYLRAEIIPKFDKINNNYKENIGNFMNYLEDLKYFIDEKILEFLNKNHPSPIYKEGKNIDYFSLEKFKKENLFFKKEIIRYLYYIRNNNSTIGLSEANISEILKFINGKNNKTIKEIKNLKMKKDGDKIYY